MNLEISTPQLILILLWLALGKLIIVGMLTAIQNSSFVEKLLNLERIPISREQTMRELKSMWVVLIDAIIPAILIYSGLLRNSTETLSNILFTFVIFFIWVEIWFYWSHRWMHQSDFLWKFHQHHHLSVLIKPLTAISFSFVEKLVFYTCGWFLFPTLLSCYIPLSIYGIAAYFTYYFITSPIVHFNKEFLYSLHKYLPKGVNLLPLVMMSHGVHHIRNDANFGMTPVLDFIFGTYASNSKEDLASLQEALR